MIVGSFFQVSQAHLITILQKMKGEKPSLGLFNMHLKSGPALFGNKVESCEETRDFSSETVNDFRSTCF